MYLDAVFTHRHLLHAQESATLYSRSALFVERRLHSKQRENLVTQFKSRAKLIDLIAEATSIITSIFLSSNLDGNIVIRSDEERITRHTETLRQQSQVLRGCDADLKSTVKWTKRLLQLVQNLHSIVSDNEWGKMDGLEATLSSIKSKLIN